MFFWIRLVKLSRVRTWICLGFCWPRTNGLLGCPELIDSFSPLMAYFPQLLLRVDVRVQVCNTPHAVSFPSKAHVDPEDLGYDKAPLGSWGKGSWNYGINIYTLITCACVLVPYNEGAQVFSPGGRSFHSQSHGLWSPSPWFCELSAIRFFGGLPLPLGQTIHRSVEVKPLHSGMIQHIDNSKKNTMPFCCI